VQRLSDSFSGGALAGVRVLVTAGPTREPIDPVRYLSNRSSGKMGYAVAEAAREAGASVVLVSGPTALDTPAGMETVRVETAAEMLDAVQGQLVTGCDLFIATAAVADYRPSTPALSKIKKKVETLSLPLQPVTDILARVDAAASVVKQLTAQVRRCLDYLSQFVERLDSRLLKVRVPVHVTHVTDGHHEQPTYGAHDERARLELLAGADYAVLERRGQTIGAVGKHVVKD